MEPFQQHFQQRTLHSEDTFGIIIDLTDYSLSHGPLISNFHTTTLPYIDIVFFFSMSAPPVEIVFSKNDRNRLKVEALHDESNENNESTTQLLDGLNNLLSNFFSISFMFFYWLLIVTNIAKQWSPTFYVLRKPDECNWISLILKKYWTYLMLRKKLFFI